MGAGAIARLLCCINWVVCVAHILRTQVIKEPQKPRKHERPTLIVKQEAFVSKGSVELSARKKEIPVHPQTLPVEKLQEECTGQID